MLAMVLLLIGAAMAGCTGDGEDPGPLTIVVNVDMLADTLEIARTTGNQTQSSSGGTFTFDMIGSTSTAGSLLGFQVDAGDGRELQYESELEFTVSYGSPGLYKVTITANDSEDNTASVTLVLRLDLNHTHTENAGNTLEDVAFDVGSSLSTAPPLSVHVNSTVTNTPGGAPPSDVDVSWTLDDSSGANVARDKQTATDGESVTFEHNETMSMPAGWWELAILSEAIDDLLGEQVTAVTRVEVRYPMDERGA